MESGFMNKLYAGTNPVGIITEILIKNAKLLGVGEREIGGTTWIKTKRYCNFSKKLTVFTSSGHYSVDKTGMALGLRLDNIIKVPCDDQKMRPDELEQLMIQVGFRLMDHKAVTCIHYSEHHYNVHSY
ncbi:unnamed protein product [Rhizophagus irregularis]|nr:unnamed protein product [Rhizophagus irregularis]